MKKTAKIKQDSPEQMLRGISFFRKPFFFVQISRQNAANSCFFRTA